MLFYFSTKKCRCRMTGSAHAGVAELADARDLKSRGSNPVPVRSRSPAPYRGIEQLVARRAHNPEVGGSSPPPATIEKPSDCKAFRPRSLGFLFAWRGQKRDFSGTVLLICRAVGIKERPRYKPRPLLAIGLLVLSSAGQNNHNRQRQDKKDNHNARLLTSMVSLRLLSVKKIVQGVTCLFIALGKHMAINIQRG